MGKAHFFLVFHAQKRENRGCRERRFDFSLRSTKLDWLSRLGLRVKVEVLIEGNVWTPKPRVFIGNSSGSLGGCGFLTSGSLKSFVFAPRGRELSY